jgi:hypothetical protein
MQRLLDPVEHELDTVVPERGQGLVGIGLSSPGAPAGRRRNLVTYSPW